MILITLVAETNNGHFEIGNFETKQEAIEAAKLDKKSDNGIYCLSGRVNYVFDEEIIL